jgi:hypothetical protein
MDTRQSERLEAHVQAAIREILTNYEKGVAPYSRALQDTTDALALELSAVIGTLPPSVRERLLAEVERFLRAGHPIA